MIRVLSIAFVWSLINGILLSVNSNAGFWSVIIWVVFSLFAINFVSNKMIEQEAKKRTPTTPITSFDQKSSLMGALIIVYIIGFVGFLIGCYITSIFTL